MTSTASIFLPDNLYPTGATYVGSLVGTSAGLTTLAIHCTAAVTPKSSTFGAPVATCGPSAPTTTITVAPSTFDLTTSSSAGHRTVAITETCTLSPAQSTGHCEVSDKQGFHVPFKVLASQYSANMHAVAITDAAGSSSTTSASSATSTSGATPTMGKSVIALVGFCALMAIVGV